MSANEVNMSYDKFIVIFSQHFNECYPIRKICLSETKKCVTRQISAIKQPYACTEKSSSVSIVGVRAWSNIDHCATCSKNIDTYKRIKEKMINVFLEIK